MKICASQDNLKRSDAKVTFSCTGMRHRLNQQFHSNLFKNEMVTNYFEILRNLCLSYGKLKLKISLPAAMVTYCFELIA
jgi:hypothetical protein